MKHTVGVYEARTRFAELLAEVEKGKRVSRLRRAIYGCVKLPTRLEFTYTSLQHLSKHNKESSTLAADERARARGTHSTAPG